jgi:TolB protein
VQIVFSLRDEEGRSIVIRAEELQAATRIFEVGPETEGLEEIDYTESSFFIHTAENLELEVVFVLDFTRSVAEARLSDGRSGIEAMLDAFEESVNRLPPAHRVGVVEFHDRNAEPSVLSELTTGRKAMVESVAEFAESDFDPGSSRLWDSIQKASTLFTSRQEDPILARALVFISDGRDTSSLLSRSGAGEIAVQGDIQLYALGIGDVFEDAQLAEVVRTTGGVYYPTGALEGLQEQLQVLVSDLRRGQYRLTYTTLRRDGEYQAQILVDPPWATGFLDSPALDVATFFGRDTQGRLTVDPPSVDTSQGTAQVFVRAEYIPRNISRFRFRLETTKPVAFALVAKEDGGLLERWDISGPDVRGFYNITSNQPLEFGNSGLLLQLTIFEFTEQRLEIPLIFDNSIYTAGKSFAYPPVINIGQRIDPTGNITFRSTRDGNPEIYVMSFDGAGQTNLTSSVADEFLATWSPDGRRIAFDSDRRRNREIFVMNADGTDVRNLSNSTSSDALPAWSPDGRLIAFDSDRNGNREIYVMNADGTNQTRLTHDPSDDLWPTWSPDGGRIVFVSYRDGDPDIYVMNADGTEQTNLTNHSAGDFRPVWSPDGRHIAFYTNRDGNREIYLMSPDGSGQRNLTNNLTDDWYPTWSPGGAHIAFTSIRDGNREVYRIYDDGTALRNLTNNPADDWAPSWGP